MNNQNMADDRASLHSPLRASRHRDGNSQHSPSIRPLQGSNRALKSQARSVRVMIPSSKMGAKMLADRVRNLNSHQASKPPSRDIRESDFDEDVEEVNDDDDLGLRPDNSLFENGLEACHVITTKNSSSDLVRGFKFQGPMSETQQADFDAGLLSNLGTARQRPVLAPKPSSNRFPMWSPTMLKRAKTKLKSSDRDSECPDVELSSIQGVETKADRSDRRSNVSIPNSNSDSSMEPDSPKHRKSSKGKVEPRVSLNIDPDTIYPSGDTGGTAVDTADDSLALMQNPMHHTKGRTEDLRLSSGRRGQVATNRLSTGASAHHDKHIEFDEPDRKSRQFKPVVLTDDQTDQELLDALRDSIASAGPAHHHHSSKTLRQSLDSAEVHRQYWWDFGTPYDHIANPKHRLWRASIYVQDAINERPIKLVRVESGPLQVYEWIQSKTWNSLIIFCSVVHLTLLFFEPTTWLGVDEHSLQYETSFFTTLRTFPKPQGCAIITIEALIIGVYMLDSILSLYSLGFDSMFNFGLEERVLSMSKWALQTKPSANTRYEKTRLFLWLCFLVDFVTVCSEAHIGSVHDRTARWSRPLRAIMPLVSSPELRRWSLVILRTTPEIFVLALFLFLLMAVYGIVALQLFSGKNECYALPDNDDDDYPNFVHRSFANIGQALIAMYVLSTTENYPVVIYPAFTCTESSWDKLYSLFFISFLGLIMFGVNVLSVPLLYTGLTKNTKEDAVVGRVLERTALHAAFELLDVEDRGWLDLDQFACLVRAVRPELFIDATALEDQRSCLGEQVPVTEVGSGFVDCFPEITPLVDGDPPDGFMLIRDDAGAPVTDAVNRRWITPEKEVNEIAFYERPQFSGAVELMYSEIASRIDDGADSDDLLDALGFFKCSEIILRDFQTVEVIRTRDSLVTRAFGNACGRWVGNLRERLIFDPTVIAAVRTFDIGITALHVLVLSLHSNNPGNDRDTRLERWNDGVQTASLVITLTVLFSVVVKLVILRVKYLRKNSNRMDLFLVPLATSLSLVFRTSPFPYRAIGSMIMTLRLFRLLLSVKIFKRLLVLFVGMEYLVSTLLIVFLTMIFWAAVGVEIYGNKWKDDDETVSSFDTFGEGLFLVFQVFTTSNWHEVLYQGMRVPGTPGNLAPFYFISFHYFATVVILQLMIAVLVEVYIQISGDPNLAKLLQLSGSHFEYLRASAQTEGGTTDSLDRNTIGQSISSPFGRKTRSSESLARTVGIVAKRSQVLRDSKSGPRDRQSIDEERFSLSRVEEEEDSFEEDMFVQRGSSLRHELATSALEAEIEDGEEPGNQLQTLVEEEELPSSPDESKLSPSVEDDPIPRSTAAGSTPPDSTIPERESRDRASSSVLPRALFPRISRANTEGSERESRSPSDVDDFGLLEAPSSTVFKPTRPTSGIVTSSGFHLERNFGRDRSKSSAEALPPRPRNYRLGRRRSDEAMETPPSKRASTHGGQKRLAPNFKNTNSAIHVMARKADPEGFDSLDTEVAESLHFHANPQGPVNRSKNRRGQVPTSASIHLPMAAHGTSPKRESPRPEPWPEESTPPE